MSDPFGGSRVQVKPPERGVFALDHDGECRESMQVYLTCLKRESNGDHFPCKKLSRAYLQCRMDKNLMASENMDHLGLGETTAEYVRKPAPTGEKEQKGFMAGLGVKASNKGFFK